MSERLPPPPDATFGPTPDPTRAPGDGHTSRRIRRVPAEGMLGGVAAGFARHFDIDVVWVRLAFVLTTVFAGGLGLIVYLAAWIIVPADEGPTDSSTTAPGGPRGLTTAGDRRRGPYLAGLALVALGGIILLDRLLAPLQARLGWLSAGQLVLPLVLIALGVLIWRSDRVDPTAVARDASLAAERIGRVVEASGERAETWGEGIERRAEAWSEAVETRLEDWEADRAARAESLTAADAGARVTPITLAAALITLGGVWLLASVGVAGMSLARALSGALLIVGLGLVAGAFLGRGRGLVLAGLLLAPAVILVTLLQLSTGSVLALPNTSTEDGVFDTEPISARPTDLSALPSSYRFGVGTVLLDLRALDREELAQAGVTELDVELGIADLTILLPAHVGVRVEVELGIGRVEIGDEVSSATGGFGVTVAELIPASDASDGTLLIRIEQGIGRVRVSR